MANVSPGYGSIKAAVFQKNVITDGGEYLPNCIPPYIDTLKRNELFDDATLLFKPAARKSGVLYAMESDCSLISFTVTRAGTSTEINSDGTSQSVAANMPVIDYSTGCPTLVVSELGEVTLTTPSTITKVIITIDGVETEYNSIFPTLTLPVGNISAIIGSDAGGSYDLLKAYLLRVDTATGTTSEDGAGDLKVMYDYLTDESLISNTELLYLSNAGMVQRTDGVLKFVRTAFDATTNDNDLDGSATASAQPRLVGGIAPNSKPAASNQNGEARYFTHTPVSFATDEAWSLTLVLNWNGSANDRSGIFENAESGIFAYLDFRISSANNLVMVNGSTASTKNYGTSNSLLGKTNVITLSSTTTGLVSYYLNGVYVTQQQHADAEITFSKLMYTSASARSYYGAVKAEIIQSGELTPTQVASLHTTLSGLYPEIESVDIDTQTWATRNFEAVASSNGTVIPQLTTQVEWSVGTSGWSYHNGATPDTPNPDNGAVYGKLYNKAGRDVIVSNPPDGWHVATEAELTVIAALGGNALKYGGTDYWATTGGTNTTGFTALGGSSRNADGTFNTIKETASFWCADSDKVLLLNHADNTATITAAAANEGHSIRLVKD
jgi:uncharacterized protein (TIGR02145 family)